MLQKKRPVSASMAAGLTALAATLCSGGAVVADDDSRSDADLRIGELNGAGKPTVANYQGVDRIDPAWAYPFERVQVSGACDASWRGGQTLRSAYIGFGVDPYHGIRTTDLPGGYWTVSVLVPEYWMNQHVDVYVQCGYGGPAGDEITAPFYGTGFNVYGRPPS